MRVEGHLIRDGRWYLVEIPLLDAVTQARTKKEAMTMAADWVVTMIGRDDVRAQATTTGKDDFVVEVSDPAALIALILRRRREAAGLSLAEVAARLGSTSKTAYARYERGTSVPSVTKFAELLHAVDPDHDLALAMR
jgi:ribosome-binding protein aMBF1 (putative translation factor)